MADIGTISLKAIRADIAARLSSNFSLGCTLSVLFNKAITGALQVFRRLRTSSSSSVQRVASVTKRIRSASASALAAVRFIKRFMAFADLRCNPGVSTKIICRFSPVSTARIRCLVVCGFAVTMLTLRPITALINVDLPTFGRPITATSPQR